VTGIRFLRPLLFSFFLIGALSGCLLAQQTSSEPEPDAAQRAVLANRYVHEILPDWQRRLHLEDWTVFILMARPIDLRPGTLGNIHWDMDSKTATIRVMDASGYSTSVADMLKDMQVTVVHELVHLELASLPVSDADRSNQENAIDNLTEALLRSKP
jgi:hypothetical protein